MMIKPSGTPSSHKMIKAMIVSPFTGYGFGLMVVYVAMLRSSVEVIARCA
jgi:hypothetical protein